jgi:hypothetical protein
MHHYIEKRGGLVWARFSALILLTAAFCGCESPVSVGTPVSEADFRDYAKPGELTVSGQVPRYSSVPVHLDPATPYADALYKALRGHNKFATINEDDTEVVDPIMLQHRKTAVADGDGAFTFEHVAPGRYYVSWYDTWMEHSVAVNNADPNPPAGITVSRQFNFDAPRGKWHFKQITVQPGESLSDVDFD